MKYVMFKKQLEDGTIYMPVIFPNSVVHSDVGEMLINGEKLDIHSAGDVSIRDATCGGSSSTLGLGSDTKDQDRIMLHDYFHGFEEE